VVVRDKRNYPREHADYRRKLSEEVEQDLHALLQGGLGEELSSQLLQNKEAALDALKHLTIIRSSPGVGPTAVGSIKDLDSIDALKAIAAAYLEICARPV
jgi:hypothetical protein